MKQHALQPSRCHAAMLLFDLAKSALDHWVFKEPELPLSSLKLQSLQVHCRQMLAACRGSLC